MQSNNNKSLNNNSNKNNDSINDLLWNNRVIFNSLIMENTLRRDKSLITVKELDYLSQIENNLQKLIEMCPPKEAMSILTKISVENNINNNIHEK